MKLERTSSMRVRRQIVGAGTLVMVLLGVSVQASAQTSSVTWTKEYGFSGFDVARAISADANNLYVLGGVTGALPGQTFHGGPDDVFLSTYDHAGNEVWTRQFGTADSDFPMAGQVGVDETGLYVAGFTTGTFPGETNTGGEDGFIRKYDFDGNVIWTDQFGTPGDEEEPNGLAVARESVIVVGDTIEGSGDSFIRRYDTSGNLIWARTYGGPGTEAFIGVAADKTGIYVSGFVTPLADLGGDWQALVLKYDFDGNIVWSHIFGTVAEDELEAVALNKDGVYVAGYTFGTLGDASAGGSDIIVRRLDRNGNTIWTRQFGSAGNDNASFRGLAADAKTVFVTGNVAGALPGHTSAGSRDVFVRRFDAAGAVLLSTQFGTAGDDRGIPVAVYDDSLFVGGRTTGTFPGHTYAGGVDGFLVGLHVND